MLQAILEEDETSNKPAAKQLSYLEMLREICRAKSCPKLTDYFVIHINTLMSYFRIGDAKMRVNAVHFLTFMLMENSHLVIESDLISPDRITAEFSKLLANDPSDDVKSVAAANYGKVLIVLQKH